MTRLRDQAFKCMFDNLDEHIMDQIIETCASSELRKKILTMDSEATLSKVVSLANTLQVVSNQIGNYEKNKANGVNAITMKNKEPMDKREDKRADDEK